MKYHEWLDTRSTFMIKSKGLVSLVVSAIIGGATLAYAAPTGGNVVAGAATISQLGATTNISQTTAKAILNWDSFSIAKNETVNFMQPNSSSVTLNRVVGTSSSLIDGMMNANGQVFLVNPNGIVFSKNAQVNVGGLVASTLNISDNNFMNSNYQFENAPDSAIINLGTITTDNGYTALLAKTVQNEGVIRATLGSVQLASGNKMTLDINGNSLVKLTIDEGTLNALVENKGLIRADGGEVYMTTQALNSVLDGMVNNSGVIEAQTIGNKDGKIVLFAHGGTAEIGGTIKAEGGFVETSGKEFVVKNGAVIKAGQWLIDPVNITIDSTLAGTIATALGSGDVTITTQGNNTPSTTSGESGADGDITVNSGISWTSNNDLTLHADRNINVNADITATGASAKLTLEYGQGAVAASNTSDYNIARSVKINLQSGQNFSTKLGSDGVAVDYTVINDTNAAMATALQNINNSSTTLAGKYALGAEVDLSGVTWTPIGTGGTSSTRFNGKFDGLGHVINHLTVSRTAPNAGLFGYVYTSGDIRNIGIINGSVQSTLGNVGGLVGNNRGTIKNSYFSGNVSSGLSEVGGLVGADSGNIYNSYATGTVSSTSTNGASANAGGLVGSTSGAITISNSYANSIVSGGPTNTGIGGLVGYLGYQGTISNSYASGSVTGGQLVGGLVGYMYEATITNSYSLANVTSNGTDNAASFTGGLVGKSDGASTLTNVYATGSVTGSFSGLLGGLMGIGGGSETMTNTYWDTTTTGQAYAISVGNITTGAIINANAYDLSTYSGFNFTNDWFMIQGFTRPFLRMEATRYVSNAHELQALTMISKGDFKLVNNIDLAPSLTNSSEIWKDNSASVNYSSYKGSFAPIGSFSAQTPHIVIAGDTVSGSFDGQGFTIDHLYINRSETLTPGYSAQVGLFSRAEDMKFDNITLSNIDITGGIYTGGLIGRTTKVTVNNDITNCAVSGSVTATDVGVSNNNYSYVGGLVGYFIKGTVSGSSSTATVTGLINTGGLVGRNDGTISNSFATGVVTGTASVGGLVGYNDIATNPGTITNSYATGNVTGSTDTGGLVGTNGTMGTITDSHATGDVTGTGNNTGGLVGQNKKTISGSYATGNVTGSGNNVGGLVGLMSLSGTISNSHSSSSVLGANNSNSKGIGGLVGTVNSGTSITSSYSTGTVNGFDDVGGLVGINNGAISLSYSNANAISTATTSVDNGDVGGFVGKNTGSITTSYATGSVTGALSADASYVGGFAGSNSDSGDISKSYATGTVTGKSAVGGFIGGNAATITNSYSSGNVTGQSDGQGIGGFAGANSATISDSYSIGQVGTGTYIGGFVGYTTANVTNSFWNFQTSGIGSDGSNNYGATAKTTSEMKNILTFSSTTPAWDIVTDSSLSNVYPQLRWATTGLGAGTSVWVISQNAIPLSYTLPSVSGSYVYNGTYQVPSNWTASNIFGSTYSSWVLGTDYKFVYNGSNGGFSDVSGFKNAVTYSSIMIDILKTGFTEASSGNTNGSFTITPKPLTISGLAASNKTYDGSPSATVTNWGSIATGITGESLTLNTPTTASFANANAANGKTVTATGYSLSDGTGGSAANYSLTSTGAETTANITKKTLTINGADSWVFANDKQYDGTTATTVDVLLGTGMASLVGLVGNQTVTVTGSGQFNNANAGYNKDVTASFVLADGTNGGVASNYEIANITKQANINKKYITVTGNFSASNKEYDGNTNASFANNNIVLDGVVTGEAITLSGLGLAFNNANAGTGKTVYLTGGSIASTQTGSANNYIFTLGEVPPTTTADITKKYLFVTGNFSADNKVYDGGTTATITNSSGLTLDGLVDGESLTISNPTASFTNKNAANGKTVRLTSATLNSTSSGSTSNYELSNEVMPTTTANITPKPLTIVGTSSENKVYDGTNSAVVSAGTLSGLVGSETLGVSATGTFDNANAGTGKTVTAVYVLANDTGSSGGLASNYTLANSTTTADITKKYLFVTGNFSADNKVYDGGTTATITNSSGLTLDGLVDGESLTISNPTASFTNKNAANGKTVRLTSATLNSTSSGSTSNYELSNEVMPTTTADITKANLTYSVAGGSKIYGEVFTLPTPTLFGGTPVETALAKVYDANNVDVTEKAIAGTLVAGTYTVKVVLSDTNYQIATSNNTSGTLTITKPAAVEDVVTSIVNSTTVKAPTEQVVIATPVSESKSIATRKVDSAIVSTTPTISADKTLAAASVNLSDTIKSIRPAVGEQVKEARVTLVNQTGGETALSTVTMSDLVAKAGGGEVRVALSPDSFVELVNGGVTLPKGVTQEFYVVQDKK